MKISQEQIENATNKELFDLIKQFQRAEYQELVHVVEHGTAEEKRQLAEKMHQGVAPARWRPGKPRLGPAKNKQVTQEQWKQACDMRHEESKRVIHEQRELLDRKI